MAEKRTVGRPRQFDDKVERQLILDSAYIALRDHGTDFTVADILTAAGVSTRSFYRHFDSKDALLRAMYLRDGEFAADRLAKRLASADSPRQAVVWWIDEIFGFTRTPKRAERVSVLGSITMMGVDGTDEVANSGRDILINSLRDAIDAGAADGSFAAVDPHAACELIATAVLQAAGLAVPRPRVDQSQTTAFCLQALGAVRPSEFDMSSRATRRRG
jgi:AcrR family transcriptional regulator